MLPLDLQGNTGGGGDAILADQIIEFLDVSNSTNSNNDAGKPITVIRNEKVIVNESLMIIGLADLWAHLRDKEKAYSDVDGVVYRILLSHNQEGFEITKENVDLFLFGHTHCGQIRLPGLGSIPKLFGFSGEYDVHVYTTCGLAPVSRLLSILRL